MAHVGQEHALRLAGRLSLMAGVAQVAGQVHQLGLAHAELAHLAQRQHTERQHQQRQEHRQCQADLVVPAHGRVALADLLRHMVRGAERQRMDRLAQGEQAGLELGQAGGIEGHAPRRGQHAVGIGDELLHLLQGCLVVGVADHQADRPLAVQQADAADPDVVAQLQRVAVEILALAARTRPLLAQAQVLGLHLVQAEHDIVVLIDHGLLQQQILSRLHHRHRGQGQRQHQAQHAEQREATPAHGGSPTSNGRGSHYCTWMLFSCHAERL